MNQHAEGEANIESKDVEKRSDVKDKLNRHKSLYREVHLFSGKHAPAEPRGAAPLSRPTLGTGPESPAQPLIRVEEEGAWRPTRPEPRPEEPPALRARVPPASGRS